MNLFNKSLFVLGRALLGFFLLLNAFNHFTNVGELAGWAAAKGVPMPEVAVVLSGILLLIGGACIVLGVWPRLAVAALVLFFVPITLVMHNFWALDSAAEAQQQMTHFYKNIALLGSALILVAIPRPWPASFARSSKSSRTGFVPDAAEVGA